MGYINTLVDTLIEGTKEGNLEWVRSQAEWRLNCDDAIWITVLAYSPFGIRLSIPGYGESFDGNHRLWELLSVKYPDVSPSKGEVVGIVIECVQNMLEKE